MIAMYDTVTVETVPPNPPAVAGYVGGSWPTYNGLVAKFPHALHLSIAVNAGENAECLDVEKGDATPAEAPAWVRRQLARGVHRPVIYCSISAAAQILAVLAAAGIAREQIRLWSAHFTFAPHICAPGCGFGNVHADATQWTDRARGRNLDESLCFDEFFAAAPPPKPADPHHYEKFAGLRDVNGRKLSERACVEEYDRLRRRPIRNRRREAVLRAALAQIAMGILERTTEDLDAHGNPKWYVNNRIWRFHQILLRAQGNRLA